MKNSGTAEETRATVAADVQPKMGFFPVTAEIDVGDVVEVPDPRAGRDVMRYAVREVESFSGGHLEHIETKWGPPPAPARPAPRKLTLDDLHAQIVEVPHGGKTLEAAWPVAHKAALGERLLRLADKALQNASVAARLISVRRHAPRIGDHGKLAGASLA